jgi:SAM-dependent methyltransferase
MYPADRPSLVRMLLEYPYLPSPLSVVDAALDLTKFVRDENFADLGCGDGIVLLRVAERFHVFSVGFEIDRRLVSIVKNKVRSAGLTHLVDVVQSDLFTADISRFDAIYVYPFPLIVQRLSEKIASECSKGAKILVHDYPLASLHPSKVVSIPGNDMHTHTVYLYTL